eukprot:s5710_g2.t1
MVTSTLKFLVDSGAKANGSDLFAAALCGSWEAMELFLQATTSLLRARFLLALTASCSWRSLFPPSCEKLDAVAAEWGAPQRGLRWWRAGLHTPTGSPNLASKCMQQEKAPVGKLRNQSLVLCWSFAQHGRRIWHCF